jgi:mannose-6-phosphate isomerase-like protein (cupin superfamily)
MKRLILISVFALASTATLAQDGGVTVWPKGIPPGGLEQKAEFGDHLLEISHREADGHVELHKTKADVIVIQSGSATILTGGEVIDPVSTGPNEIQGTGIKGGVRHEVSQGDVVEIPAGVLHQFFLKTGTQITYLVVKIIKDQPKP